MTERHADSVGHLISGVLGDARDLIREELAMFRTELQEEVRKGKAVSVTFASAAVVGLVGLFVLALALGAAIANWFAWPLWAGHGLVALLLLAGAGVLAYLGTRVLSSIHALPRTRATLQENLAWIQSKSTQP